MPHPATTTEVFLHQAVGELRQVVGLLTEIRDLLVLSAVTPEPAASADQATEKATPAPGRAKRSTPAAGSRRRGSTT